MRFGSILVAAGIAAFSRCAGAGGRPGDADWVEAQSLRELPAGVQVLVGVGLGPENGGIADRGEPFNGTDARIVGVSPPQRRFVLGLVGADTVLIAIERGGLGKFVQTVELKQAGATWEIRRCAATYDVPEHGAQLLEALATRPRHDWYACGLPGAERPADMPPFPRAPPIPPEHR